MQDGTLLPEWYSGSDGDTRPVGVRLRQGEGASETLAQFNLECKKAGPSGCALAQLGDPATVVEDLYERLTTKPVDLVLPDGSTLKVTYATVNGWGHTTLGKSACADATITAYLVKLTAPVDGTTCEQDRKPFDPLPQARSGATVETRLDVPPGVNRWGTLGL